MKHIFGMHEHANADMISIAIEGFDWDEAFPDKSAGEKASFLAKTIFSIMSNFIPNETVTLDNRDSSWNNNK